MDKQEEIKRKEAGGLMEKVLVMEDSKKCQ